MTKGSRVVIAVAVAMALVLAVLAVVQLRRTHSEAAVGAADAVVVVAPVPDSVRYSALKDRVRRNRDVFVNDKRVATLQRLHRTLVARVHAMVTEQKRKAALVPRPSGGLLVGDSVSLGAQTCLDPLGYHLDSEVGRPFSTGFERLKVHAANGLPNSVVVELGTNGPFSSGQFAEVMDLLGSRRRVVWVTIHLPDRSQYAFRDSLNAMIREMSSHYSNVRIADFDKVSASHPEWFYGDGVHLSRSAACQGYAKLIDDAVTAPVGQR